jgi:hypothetical protein
VICWIAGEAFATLPSYFIAGESEHSLAQKFQANLMLHGAEKTPYVAMFRVEGLLEWKHVAK